MSEYGINFEDDVFSPTFEVEPFGTKDHFRGAYRAKVNSFLTEFLHSNIEEIIKNSENDLEKIKNQISNLVEVHYQVRQEFDKHKFKLL